VVNTAGGMWGLTDAQMVAANVTLVENVLTAMTKLSRPARLIHLGSVHEYGLAAVGTSLDEAYQPNPVTTYAELKLRCTDAVTAAADSGSVDAVVLRAGNITGGGQPAVSLLGIVADELWAARCDGRRGAVTMKSLGALRDFMTLADAINAIVTVTKVPELPSRVFNIGTGKAACARDLVRTLVEVSGVPTDVVETEPGGPETTWQQMCVRKARLLLGWVPRHDLVDGIKELWAHHTETREG
jgi:dTDP-6-deoxy-L-talose 4-dehydrogenase [NAD(P)+]